MQRTGSAEREQAKVARVVAARQRNHANSACHAIIGDTDDRARRGDRIQSELAADLLVQTSAQRIVGYRSAYREETRLVKSAEQKIGIGDRYTLTATAETYRSRQCTSALRADLQQACIVHPCYRATTGADGVYVDHGNAQRHAILELKLGRHKRQSVLD